MIIRLKGRQDERIFGFTISYGRFFALLIQFLVFILKAIRWHSNSCNLDVFAVNQKLGDTPHRTFNISGRLAIKYYTHIRGHLTPAATSLPHIGLIYCVWLLLVAKFLIFSILCRLFLASAHLWCNAGADGEERAYVHITNGTQMSVDQFQKPIEIVLINIQIRCNLNDQIFLNQFYGVVPCFVPNAHRAGRHWCCCCCCCRRTLYNHCEPCQINNRKWASKQQFINFHFYFLCVDRIAVMKTQFCSRSHDLAMMVSFDYLFWF